MRCDLPFHVGQLYGIRIHVCLFLFYTYFMLFCNNKWDNREDIYIALNRFASITHQPMQIMQNAYDFEFIYDCTHLMDCTAIIYFQNVI